MPHESTDVAAPAAASPPLLGGAVSCRRLTGRLRRRCASWRGLNRCRLEQDSGGHKAAAALHKAEEQQAVALTRAFYEAQITADTANVCAALSRRARTTVEQSSSSARNCTAILKDPPEVDTSTGLITIGTAPSFYMERADPSREEPTTVDRDLSVAQLRQMPGRALQQQPARLLIFFGNLSIKAVPVVREGSRLAIDAVPNDELVDVQLDRDTPAGALGRCMLQKLKAQLTDQDASLISEQDPDQQLVEIPVADFSYTVGTDSAGNGGGTATVRVMPTARAAEYQFELDRQGALIGSINKGVSRLGDLIVSWIDNNGEERPLPEELKAIVMECADRSDVSASSP